MTPSSPYSTENLSKLTLIWGSRPNFGCACLRKSVFGFPSHEYSSEHWRANQQMRVPLLFVESLSAILIMSPIKTIPIYMATKQPKQYQHVRLSPMAVWIENVDGKKHPNIFTTCQNTNHGQHGSGQRPKHANWISINIFLQLYHRPTLCPSPSTSSCLHLQNNGVIKSSINVTRVILPSIKSPASSWSFDNVRSNVSSCGIGNWKLGHKIVEVLMKMMLRNSFYIRWRSYQLIGSSQEFQNWQCLAFLPYPKKGFKIDSWCWWNSRNKLKSH